MKREDQDVFIAARGEDNDVLPGEIFDTYRCRVALESMTFTSAKGESFVLAFPLLSEAGFSAYVLQGNLWFRCRADGKRFSFSVAPKDWRSPSGKMLLERVGHYVKIDNLGALETYLHDGPANIFLTLLTGRRS